MESKKDVVIYTDGACSGNPGPGGYAAVLIYNGMEKEISDGAPDTTNNKMELTACIEGLKALKEPCDVEIVSDSKYVCEAINSWLENWIKKDFKNVKNKELWLSYIQTSKPHKIQAKWIKGHNGHIENERCDKIAKEEALILKDSIKGIK